MSIKLVASAVSRGLIVRVKAGDDLLTAIEEACTRSGFTSGVISCCIGSLRKACFMFLVPSDNQMGAKYCDPVTIEGPVEILSAQGSVGQEDGRIFIHLHGSFSDPQGHVHGGHLIKGQNPVLFTAEIAVCEWAGVRMLRLYDPQVDMKVLTPLEEEGVEFPFKEI